MLQHFVMTPQKTNTAICAGTIVAVALGLKVLGPHSPLAYMSLPIGLSLLFVRWFARMRREDMEEFLRQRKRDREQQSRYEADLQHMPEAQRIVAVHQAMEAWKALGRP